MEQPLALSPEQPYELLTSIPSDPSSQLTNSAPPYPSSTVLDLEPWYKQWVQILAWVLDFLVRMTFPELSLSTPTNLEHTPMLENTPTTAVPFRVTLETNSPNTSLFNSVQATISSTHTLEGSEPPASSTSAYPTVVDLVAELLPPSVVLFSQSTSTVPAPGPQATLALVHAQYIEQYASLCFDISSEIPSSSASYNGNKDDVSKQT